MLKQSEKQQKMHQISAFEPVPAQERKEIKYRKPRVYTWTLKQQQTYLDFLKKNVKVMISSTQRRNNKVFKTLSALLKTRNSIQVKTHHQKLQKKLGSIYQIIKQLQDYIKGCKEKRSEKTTISLIDEESSLKIVDGICQNILLNEQISQNEHTEDKNISEMPRLLFSIDTFPQRLIFFHDNEDYSDFLSN